MSIRGLFSTAVNSSEVAIKGGLELGKVIGNGTEYLVRQSNRWNDENVIKTEEVEHKAQLVERMARAVGYTGDYNLEDVIAEKNNLDNAFNELFK